MILLILVQLSDSLFVLQDLNSIMILLIQRCYKFIEIIRENLNSIMILLIHTQKIVMLFQHPNLNSIMILLIHHTLSFFQTTLYTFKFHYDSINS